MNNFDEFNDVLPEIWIEGDALVNGIRIHYYRAGTNKRPLIFAHGLSDNGLCWYRVAKALENEHDMVMVDARGHGKSDKPDRDYSPLDHAKDLAGLIESLELLNPVVIGHSMGGMTAALAASNFPHLVRAAILEDPPWFDRVEDNSEIRSKESKGFQLWLEELKSLSYSEIIQVGKEQNPAWSEEEYPTWAKSKQQASPQVKEYILDSTIHWQDIVRECKVPALLMTADVDLGAIVTEDIAQKAENLNPLFETVHISGAGHNIRREQFSNYMATIRKFLTKVADI